MKLEHLNIAEFTARTKITAPALRVHPGGNLYMNRTLVNSLGGWLRMHFVKDAETGQWYLVENLEEEGLKFKLLKDGGAQRMNIRLARHLLKQWAKPHQHDLPHTFRVAATPTEYGGVHMWAIFTNSPLKIGRAK